MEKQIKVTFKQKLVIEDDIAEHHIQTVMEGQKNDGYSLLIIFKKQNCLYQGLFELIKPVEETIKIEDEA